MQRGESGHVGEVVGPARGVLAGDVGNGFGHSEWQRGSCEDIAAVVRANQWVHVLEIVGASVVLAREGLDGIVSDKLAESKRK